MKENDKIEKKALDIIKKPLKIKILIFSIGFGGTFLIVLLLIMAVISLFKPILDVFQDDESAKKNNMTEKLTNEEEKFKKRVNEVYEEIKKDKNVSIDRAVLTATVTYTGDFEAMYDNDNYKEITEDIFEGESFKETESSSIKSWLNEHVFHNTPEYKELRRLRVSKMYLKGLGYAQIENGKIDLEAYEKYLAENVVSYLYPELVKGNNSSSAKQIAREIMELAEMYYAYFGEEKTENCGTGTSCKYNIEGKEISNLKVRLLQCVDMTRGEPIPGEELIDFEKYVLGVTYGEIDQAFPTETNKAQAIAARTFALARAQGMGGAYNIGIIEENGQWILQIRNCTEDQVYCDPDKGCSKNGGVDTTTLSGTDRGTFYKNPLPEDAQLRIDVADTNGKILLDKNGNIVKSVSYMDNIQRQWEAEAKSGKDHTEILLSHYTDAVAISESNCTDGKGDSSCSQNITGPFAGWKQCDPAWGNIGLGSSNICTIGCLATSVAIQAAASGAASSIEGFNPGKFVQMGKEKGIFDSGGNMYQGNVSKLIPGFSLAGGSSLCGKNKGEKVNIIQKQINEGYYVVLEVKGNSCGGSGQHWVAVSGTSENEINMMDPASTETGVFAKYGNMASYYNIYRKN